MKKRIIMKDNITRFKKVAQTIGIFMLIVVITFAFLSLCNWSYLLKEWTGFSRFLLGAVGVFFLIKLYDDIW